MKFILSIFVVAIHSVLFPKVLYPWLKIAVPLFFVITAFLFFKKLEILPKEEHNKALFKFVKRNLILYFVWFVILLPVTVLTHKSWFDSGVGLGLLVYVTQFFMGGTFLASWFIMASVIAVVIIYFLSKKINIIILLTISGIILFGCYTLSGYGETVGLLGYIDDLLILNIGKIKLTSNVYYTFIVALFWVALGKGFADGTIKISRKSSIIGVIVCALLFLVEHILVTIFFKPAESRGAFLMLVPFCTFIFALAISFKDVKIKNAKTFRKCSTIMYVSHTSIIATLQEVFNFFGVKNTGLHIFLLALALSTILYFIIVKLSTFRRLKFLKYLF